MLPTAGGVGILPTLAICLAALQRSLTWEFLPVFLNSGQPFLVLESNRESLFPCSEGEAASFSALVSEVFFQARLC